MKIEKTIEINLKDGQIMTLDMTPQLIGSIRTAFMLDETSEITERHVKYYLISSIKNALAAEGSSEGSSNVL